MRERTRQKGLKASQDLLGTQATVISYGMGLVGPDPRRTTWYILGGAVVVVVLIALTTGALVLPGFVVLAVIYYAVDRPTNIALTDRGVALLGRSVVNGLPTKVLNLAPPDVLAESQVQRSGAFVLLPSQRLWLRKKEYEALTASASAITHLPETVPGAAPWVSPPAPVPVGPASGWYPMEGSAEEQVLWNGRMYTARRVRRADSWKDVPLNFYSGGPPDPDDRQED